MPDAYTHGHHESVLRSHEVRTAADSAAYLLPHLRPGMRVLDVGAGPGTITVDLAQLVAPGEVVGVDASADVVARAQQLAALRQAQGPAQAQGPTNLSFRVGDGYALDVPDASFDVVHAHQVLQHVSDPVRMLREFRRVAGPVGLVAARDVDYEGVLWHPRIPALDDWLALYLRVHRATAGEPAAGRLLPSWARAAGFADVEASASAWLFASEERRAWWGGLWADRVLASSFADRAIDLELADRDALERIADGWREWAADPDATILLPHVEILARG